MSCNDYSGHYELSGHFAMLSVRCRFVCTSDALSDHVQSRRIPNNFKEGSTIRAFGGCKPDKS